MDGLSGAASVVGIIGFAGQLAKSALFVCQFIGDFSDVPERMRGFCDELGLLVDILQDIESHYSAPPQTLQTALEQCKDCVDELLSKIREFDLEPGLRQGRREAGKRKWRRFLAVCKQPDLDRLMQNVQRSKSSLHQAHSSIVGAQIRAQLDNIRALVTSLTDQHTQLTAGVSTLATGVEQIHDTSSQLSSQIRDIRDGDARIFQVIEQTSSASTTAVTRAVTATLDGAIEGAINRVLNRALGQALRGLPLEAQDGQRRDRQGHGSFRAGSILSMADAIGDELGCSARTPQATETAPIAETGPSSDAQLPLPSGPSSLQGLESPSSWRHLPPQRTAAASPFAAPPAKTEWMTRKVKTESRYLIKNTWFGSVKIETRTVVQEKSTGDEAESSSADMLNRRQTTTTTVAFLPAAWAFMRGLALRRQAVEFAGFRLAQVPNYNIHPVNVRPLECDFFRAIRNWEADTVVAMLQNGEGSIYDLDEHGRTVVDSVFSRIMMYNENIKPLEKTINLLAGMGASTASLERLSYVILRLAEHRYSGISKQGSYSLATALASLDLESDDACPTYWLKMIYNSPEISARSSRLRSLFSPHLFCLSRILLPASLKHCAWYWDSRQLAAFSCYINPSFYYFKVFDFISHIVADTQEDFAAMLESEDSACRKFLDCCLDQLRIQDQNSIGPPLDTDPQPAINALIDLFESAGDVSNALTTLEYNDGELAWVRHRSAKASLLYASLTARCLDLLRAFYAPLDSYKDGPILPILPSEETLNSLTSKAALGGDFVLSAWLKAVRAIKEEHRGETPSGDEQLQYLWQREPKYVEAIRRAEEDPKYDRKYSGGLMFGANTDEEDKSDYHFWERYADAIWNRMKQRQSYVYQLLYRK